MSDDKLEFTVVGGGFDPMANPMPKIKLTARQQWLERAQNYVIWKEHVAEACLKAMQEQQPDEFKAAEQEVAGGGKPITTDPQPMHMAIHIFWRGKAHADPENVFGSIADALFKQDKYLTGEFNYTHLGKTEQPYVKITIQKYADTRK